MWIQYLDNFTRNMNEHGVQDSYMQRLWPLYGGAPARDHGPGSRPHGSSVSDRDPFLTAGIPAELYGGITNSMRVGRAQTAKPATSPGTTGFFGDGGGGCEFGSWIKILNLILSRLNRTIYTAARIIQLAVGSMVEILLVPSDAISIAILSSPGSGSPFHRLADRVAVSLFVWALLGLWFWPGLRSAVGRILRF